MIDTLLRRIYSSALVSILGLPTPLTAQQTVKQRVLDLTGHLPALAQIPFALKAEAFKCLDRSGIAWIDVSFKTMEFERCERIAQHGVERFAHVTLAPKLMPESITDFSPAMSEVEIEQSNASY